MATSTMSPPRPAVVTEPVKQTAEIPVIDISESNIHAAHDILAAAAKFGFVYVKNNEAAGMPGASIARMFELSKEFFQSPKEVKETCAINSNKSGKNQGWLGMHTETLDPGNQKRGDFKEAFNLGEILPGKPITQPLPPPLLENSATLAAFTAQCHTLCTRILQLFATALQLPSTWFSDRHDQSKGPSGTIMRLLYYPHVPTSGPEVDEADIRAGAHSDYGSVTLLFQLPGQPGLEILTPEGAWASVPVDPSGDALANGGALPILVNIGDLLEYWTDGLLKSTVHRVVFPHSASSSPDAAAGQEEREEGKGDRYSMAYFCHPLDDAVLEAVPSPLVQGRSRGEGNEKGMERNEGVLTARDHLNQRLAATYGIKS